MSDVKIKEKTTNTKTQFLVKVTGEVRTLNLLKDGDDIKGVRGKILLTPESVKAIEETGFAMKDETAIYKLTYNKIAEWKGTSEIQIGDTIDFGSVSIHSYKGNVQDWKGLPYLSLCVYGLIEIHEGERKSNGKFRPKSFFKPSSAKQQPCQKQTMTKANPISKPKVIGTDKQLFKTLLTEINQAREALKRLESITTVSDVLSINSKDFHKLSTNVTLTYNRMYSTILHILDR